MLLDFVKYNVRHYVTEIVVKVWVDLDPDHYQGYLFPTSPSPPEHCSAVDHARSLLMLKVINKLVN